MSHICVIPCKAGSQRLFRKNFAIVGERPAFYWPTLAAQQSGLFDTIVLSSDLPDFINIIRGLSGDFRDIRVVQQRPSTMLGVARDAVREVWDGHVDRVSVALATAVLLRAEDIQGAVALSEREQRPVVASAEATWDIFTMQGAFFTRAPVEAPYYIDAGAFYTMSGEDFWAAHSLAPPMARPYIIPKSRAVDIDVQDDLDLARLLFEQHPA